MSDRTYVKDEPGIYCRVHSRGPLRGKSVYSGRVWVKSERRFRYFRLGTNIRQAKHKLASIAADPEAALKAREASPPAEPTMFADLLDRFLKLYRSRGDSGYYGHVAKSWRGYFGRLAVEQIDRARVEDYREHLRRDGYGPSTIRKYVGALGTMFRWAKGRGEVAENPVEGVKRPPEPDRNVAVLSREEADRLLDRSPAWLRDVIELFLESGMRRGEGLALCWTQIARDRRAILIDKSKTGRARSIPLNARLTGVLDRATRHVRSEFVLCGRDGNPLDPHNLTRAVNSALQRAGIDKSTGAVFNLFRHTFGSRLAERGVEMSTIATIMGNSPEICYRHYVSFSPGHLRGAMELLDGPARFPTAPQTAPRGSEGLKSEASRPTQVVEY